MFFYHHSSYPHVVCSYCQFFDHDMNSYPYYDAFDKSYARLTVVIGIMNKQHAHFVSKMRECPLVIRPNLVCPSLDLRLVFVMIVSLPFPLESNVVDDPPLTNLKEVFHPSITSLPLVASSFSSTLIATSVRDLTLLASPLPLAHCMRLEMDEISKVMLVL